MIKLLATDFSLKLHHMLEGLRGRVLGCTHCGVGQGCSMHWLQPPGPWHL